MLSVFFRTTNLPQRGIWFKFTLESKNYPLRRVSDRLHFSEVSAFSQIRQAPGRSLFAAVDSYLPPAQKNMYVKVTFF